MGMLERVRGWWNAQRSREHAQTAETLERIVQLANPRLRFARRYRARLAPAVLAAMEYAAALVAAVPAAHDATAAAWPTDGCLRAFFAVPPLTSRTGLPTASSFWPRSRPWSPRACRR